MDFVTRLLTRLIENSLFGWARAMQQGSLLWVLAIAVQNGQPLAPVVEAFAGDARGRWQGRLWALAELLNTGVPLAEALERLPGILPTRSVMAISIGAEVGSLKVALREEAVRFASEHADSQPYYGFVSFLWYPCTLAFVMLNIVAFVMYWIIPKFKKIYEGFDVELPGITVTLIAASDLFVNYWYLVPPLLLALFAFAMTAGNEATGPWTWGPFEWTLRFRPRRATADILRRLSVIIEAQRSLTAGLAKMMELQPSASIRRRLREVATALLQGQDCWHALLAARLIKPGEAMLLDAAQRAGNVPWALRELADAIERRHRRRLAILLEFVRPAVMLCFGLIVAFVVVGLFMPLIKLVHDLS